MRSVAGRNVSVNKSAFSAGLVEPSSKNYASGKGLPDANHMVNPLSLDED